MNSGIIPRNGVLVLSGYGLSARIDRAHLCLTDGIADERRDFKLSRITRLKRLVIVGHSGSVSLDALRWLRDRGAALVVIDGSEVIMAEGALRLDYARVRRAQAIVSGSPVGLEIAKGMLRRKLLAQAELLERQFADSVYCARAIRECADKLSDAPTVEAARHLESDAAQYYWRMWRSLQLDFDGPVPEHWLGFETRLSAVTGVSARKADRPVNAIANYLYALLESEVRIAVLALGLDPGLGFTHADQDMRANLVMDLLELHRPVADEIALSVLREKLTGRDFHETREGQCRLLAPMCHRLAENMPRFRDLVSHTAESLCQQLSEFDISPWQPARLGVVKGRPALPTPLTQSKRSASRPKRKTA